MEERGQNMLRTTTKNKLNSIWELLLKLHQKGIMEQPEILPEVLEECQQTALAVGQRLEKEIPERSDIVEKLEQYCEQLYLISQQPEQKEMIAARLDAWIAEIKNQIEQIPTVIQAVFMPYKAEMWDSLESVWMAFDKDERCEALVMPLPYSKFEAAENRWNPCYEGERFPEYVPITDYQNYHLDEEYPEFIFIHNAYDEYNRVTRIDPEYFSIELKKYTKNLVYIPYYLTGGMVSEAHKILSAYRYVDYIVVQSELFKSGFKGTVFYDKVLALGSPKLDRVIRLCQEEKQMPEAWKEVIGERKCVMLNTSLSYFLRFGKYYLRRIRLCFEWLKENPIVGVIWRPHPLLESTIRSMHPELLTMYQELVEYFLESGIGVLDQTPDIEKTIALVDGYIGDNMTSVTNLFGAAGKPMFILNAVVTRPYTREEQRRVTIADVVELDGKLWMTPWLYNGLLCVGEDWNQVELVHRFEEQPKWQRVYSYMLERDKTLYFNPVVSNHPILYRIDEEKEIDMTWNENGNSRWWMGIYQYESSIFGVSGHVNDVGIYEYNQSNKEWLVYNKCMKEFLRDRPQDSVEPLIAYTISDGENLWITAGYSNRILKFNMRTKGYVFYRIGAENNGYVGICIDRDLLYLGEPHGNGKLLAVNLLQDTVAEYDLPKHDTFRNLSNVERAFGNIYNMGKYLVLMPGLSYRMWRFEKATGEWLSLAEEFWEQAAQPTDNHLPQSVGVYSLCKAMNHTTIWVQRLYDDAVLILNIETGEYEVKYMHLSEKSYELLTKGQDGFEKVNIAAPFVQMESRYFQFGDFIQKIVSEELEEAKERQKKELITLAANMDGVCGEKIHEHFMRSCI